MENSFDRRLSEQIRFRSDGLKMISKLSVPGAQK